MMRQLPTIAVTIALAGLLGTAADAGKASQRTAVPPIYIKHTEVNVIITNGVGHQAVLSAGYNILGNQHLLGCDHDEGCLVTVATMVGISDVTGSWSICFLVDGVPATPRCPPQNAAVGQEGGVGNGLGSFLLSKGRHLVETDVFLKDSGGAHLGNWEAHYTMFLDPPQGN